jgi:hypothetical protein
MSGEHYTYTPFDEQAAKETLERLRLAVEQSRKRRKDLSDEFDAFVSSFKKDRYNPSPTTRATPPAVVEEIRPAASTSTYDEPMAYRPRTPVARWPLPKTGVVVGAVAFVAAGIMLTRAWRGAPSEQLTAAAPATPARSDALPSAGTPAAFEPIPGMLQGELAALRRVWIRATVDGARVLERELQPNERVTLRPARTVVVRAGDGGAVRIVIDGRDRGPLGANGIALTRTFTAAAPANR